MLITGVEGDTGQLETRSPHLIVGIFAEVYYHDGGIGDTIHVMNRVGESLRIFLMPMNGLCSFLPEGQYSGH